jgi:hypothetical protein
LLQEKKALKEEKLKQEEKFMWAIVDGVKEKVLSLSLSLSICYIYHPEEHSIDIAFFFTCRLATSE